MRSYSSWKTNSAQFRTRVTRHQHIGDETAQHHPRAGRSQSVEGWIGHEPAMKEQNLFHIIMKTVQRKKPFIQRSESGDTEQIKTPQIQCAEKRDSPGAENRHDRPYDAKTVVVATCAVHPESAAEH